MPLFANSTREKDYGHVSGNFLTCDDLRSRAYPEHAKHQIGDDKGGVALRLPSQSKMSWLIAGAEAEKHSGAIVKRRQDLERAVGSKESVAIGHPVHEVCG